MTQTAKLFFLLLVAIAHAFAFLYAWHFFGSHASFWTLGATHSPFTSFLVSSLVAAAVATAPLALLAGFVGGERLITPAVSFFLAAWIAFHLYAQGFSAVIRPPTSITLPLDLAAITAFGVMFLLVGSRSARRRIAA